MVLSGCQRGFLTAIGLLTVIAAASGQRVVARQAESRGTIAISVDDPRPLAAAIVELEKKYGWVVTYEDPAYLDASEITTQPAPAAIPEAKPTAIPYGRPFEFRGELVPDVTAQASAAVRAVVAEYNRVLGADVFEVRSDGAAQHVVPRLVLNVDGTRGPYTSILDAKISLPQQTGTAIEAVYAVVTELRKTVDPRVRSGSTGVPQMGAPVVWSARNEQASDVLMRILRQIPKLKVSWRLLCAPGKEGICALNLYAVPSIPGGTLSLGGATH